MGDQFVFIFFAWPPPLSTSLLIIFLVTIFKWYHLNGYSLVSLYFASIVGKNEIFMHAFFYLPAFLTFFNCSLGVQLLPKRGGDFLWKNFEFTCLKFISFEFSYLLFLLWEYCTKQRKCWTQITDFVLRLKTKLIGGNF